MTVRLGAPFTSYNNGTASDNATANQEVVNATDQSITWNLASWSLQ